MRQLSRILTGLREFAARQVELTERRALEDRPWEEEFLHWAGDGELHGEVVPPPGRHSTTRSGWCPGPHHTRSPAGAGSPLDSPH